MQVPVNSPSDSFINRMNDIVQAKYVMLDDDSKVQVTKAFPFYIEKFKELFGLSHKANSEKIENALVTELQNNNELLTDSKNLPLLGNIAQKCLLILGNKKTHSKHEALAQEINKIINDIHQSQEFSKEKSFQVLKKDGRIENINPLSSSLKTTEASVIESVQRDETSKNKDVAELPGHNAQLQEELQHYQEFQRKVKENQEVLEKTLQSYLEKDFSGIKVEVKNGDKGVFIQVTGSDKDLGFEATALGVYITAALRVVAPQIDVTTINSKKENGNTLVTIPIGTSELMRFDKAALLTFSINTMTSLQEEILRDVDKIILNLQKMCEINSINDIDLKWRSVNIGQSYFNKKTFYFQNDKAYKSYGNPVEGISISYNTETKMLLLNSLPIQTEKEAMLIQDFFKTLNTFSSDLESSKIIPQDSPLMTKTFDNFALTPERNQFSLQVGIKRKINQIRHSLEEKMNISENSIKEFLTGKFKVKIQKDVFEIMDLTDALSIKQDEKGELTVNDYSDRNIEQEQLIYDLLQQVGAAVNNQSNDVNSFIEKAKKFFPPKLIPIQLAKPEPPIVLKELNQAIPPLKKGQNVTSEQLIAAINKFKAVAPRQPNEEKVYELRIKDLPLVDIVHRSDGLFYIQHHSVYMQYGREGSGSISIKNNEVRIGNSGTFNQRQLNAAYSVLHAISTEDTQEIEDAFLLLKAANATSFDNIHTSKLIDIPILFEGINNNSDLLPRKLYQIFYEENPDEAPQACIISTSNWIPKNFVAQDDGSLISFSEHLMKRKKPFALGVKWEDLIQFGNMIRNEITQMEAALHSFFVPMSLMEMTVDALWMGRFPFPSCPLEPGKGRSYILSTSIQPDMEYDGNQAVILALCGLDAEEIKGEKLDPSYIFPAPQQKQDSNKRKAHDFLLQKYMIFNLYSKGTKPKKEDIETVDLDFLNKMIHEGNPSDLVGKAIVVNGKTISLEAMFNFYKEQLACELLALENQCSQGYIFTIDPPSLFIQAIGGARNAPFLNRLQALAMKQLIQEGKIKNMKAVAFNNYADEKMIELYKAITKDHHIQAYPKVVDPKKGSKGLFAPNGKCLIDPNDPSVIVLHNNSDGFGYNLENEGETSLDGLMGCMSNASCVYEKSREDLTRHIFTQQEWLRLRELRKKFLELENREQETSAQTS